MQKESKREREERWYERERFILGFKEMLTLYLDVRLEDDSSIVLISEKSTSISNNTVQYI